jgi:myo-inositol-1(or 4)-monophosphatase
MNALAARFETAVRLATEAGALALRMRPPAGAAIATLKGAQDWLTEADGAVERLLSERLAAEWPDDGFQGEEGGEVRSGTLRWVVDPIDGTANFMRGAPRFCVSLGCLEGETPVIGVIVAPGHSAKPSRPSRARVRR